MAVSPLTAVQGAVLYLALCYKLYQLVKAPRDVPLRAVVGCLGCAALAYPIGIAGNAGHTGDIKPLYFGLAQYALLMGCVYCINLFFLFAGLDAAAARRRALRDLIPFAAALAVMTVAGVLTPPDVPLLEQTNPVVAVFFVATDLYLAVGFGSALVGSRFYARAAEPTLARGLVAARTGLASVFAGSLLFTTTVVLRVTTGDAPAIVVRGGATLILLGAIVFLAGVCYPGAVMRLAALRIWLAHRRAYHRLHPLWTELHTAFPEDALNRTAPGRWRDVLSLRGMHRRYYRRVIECRDGLVRLSPYLAETGGLRAALDAHAAGAPAGNTAMPIALPPTPDLDADVRELVALSESLST